VRQLHAELRAIGRRLDAIEQQVKPRERPITVAKRKPRVKQRGARPGSGPSSE